jgi:hypothetical protein
MLDNTPFYSLPFDRPKHLKSRMHSELYGMGLLRQPILIVLDREDGKIVTVGGVPALSEFLKASQRLAAYDMINVPLTDPVNEWIEGRIGMNYFNFLLWRVSVWSTSYLIHSALLAFKAIQVVWGLPDINPAQRLIRSSGIHLMTSPSLIPKSVDTSAASSSANATTSNVVTDLILNYDKQAENDAVSNSTSTKSATDSTNEKKETLDLANSMVFNLALPPTLSKANLIALSAEPLTPHSLFAPDDEPNSTINNHSNIANDMIPTDSDPSSSYPMAAESIVASTNTVTTENSLASSLTASMLMMKSSTTSKNETTASAALDVDAAGAVALIGGSPTMTSAGSGTPEDSDFETKLDESMVVVGRLNYLTESQIFTSKRHQ